MRKTLLILLLRNFYRYSIIWPPVGLLLNIFGNFSSNKTWNIQASNFSLVSYLKFFRTSQLELTMINLYYFKAYLPKSSLLSIPLTGSSICKQGVWQCFSSSFNLNLGNQQAKLFKIVW